jgi:hypothetical protein
MEWISVIDLMPMMYDPVLTMFYRGGSMSAITIRALCSDGWMNEGGILCPKVNVTHWMPLPEPPKESD